MGLQAKLIASGIALMLLVGFLGWIRHQIYVADTSPLINQYQSDLERKTGEYNTQVATLNTRATDAEGKANEAQKSLDDYVAQHPTGAVRMQHCKSATGTTQAGAGQGGTGAQGSDSGSGSVGAVQGGNPGQVQLGPDIGPDIDAFMRATLTLVVVGQECEANLPP